MKRGLADLPIIIFAIVILVFGFILTYYLQGQINTGIIAAINQTGLNTTAAEAMLNNSHAGLAVFGNGILFVIFMLGIAGVVLAAFIPANPVFLPFSIILLAVYTFLAQIFGNFLYNLLAEPTFVSTANSFPMLVILAQYSHWVILAFGLITIALQYSPISGGGGVGRNR